MRNFDPSRSRRPSPARAAIVLLIGIALLGAACSKGGDDPQSDGSGQGQVPPPSSKTPDFDFTVDRVTPYTAAPGHLPKGIPPEAQKASEAIAAQASLLYQAAYLDPANWKEGTYDSFFAGFDQKSGGAAKGQVEDLTAGTSAGEMYTDIQPGFAHLNVKVMLDDKGKPMIGVAIVDFNASATTTDGTETNLHSDGQYFLRPKGNGWEVFAYDVNRQDGGDIPEMSTTAPEGDKPAKDEKDKDKEEA